MSEKFKFVCEKDSEKNGILDELYSNSLICDPCDVIENNINLGNTKESMLLIAKEHNTLTNDEHQYYIVETYDGDKYYVLLANLTAFEYEDDSKSFIKYLNKKNILLNFK